MESEGSLPHSQQPATCLSTETDQLCPCPNIQIIENKFWYYPPI